ncbi:2OG-Fe(II) oxygenase [Shewanella sp.]|uniref:2OG-Fe(II) oxygenase n=1 Tax=Shewanella sp. TaxID=50422 RepID=UPI001ECBF27D|nr:2OG-Fe(II) oxygenase [Shewanella sp.]NRB23604.1 2OG-Fe(II) oxygenase [Shewanella sp.]
MTPVATYEHIIDELANRDYVVVDGLIESEILFDLRAELIKKHAGEALQRAEIGNGANRTINDLIRSDKISWIDKDSRVPCEQAYYRAVLAFSTYLNRACFTGISDFEFHYACYERGTFYQKHVDRFKNDAKRKFSFITYLNDTWQYGDGGELKLHLEDKVIEVQPIFGNTVIFKSHLIEHEVVENNMVRYSVTGWLK